MEHDRILGYFLEEASEHLNTIEQGLRKLPETVRQPTMIRELFRAAHSIKGSAAMLGLVDVQKIGNQFEANFRLLKEHPQIAVDTQLQSLFLESFGFLQAGINDVRIARDPYTRDPELGDPIGDPVFEELKAYLQHLVATSEAVETPTPERSSAQDPALQQVFGEYVTRKLDELTSLCLQADSPEIRVQMQQICQKLGNLGENFEFLEWTNLFTACRLAIANPSNFLAQLGQSISIAVKQAQVLVLADRHQSIGITPDLEALIASQHRTTKSPLSPSENPSTWKLDESSAPMPGMVMVSDGTTQKLPELVSISGGKVEASEVEFQSLSSLSSMNFTDSLVAVDTEYDADAMELNEFMNLLNDDMPSEGTWMQDDDFLARDLPLLDLGNSDTDRFYSQMFEPNPDSAATDRVDLVPTAEHVAAAIVSPGSLELPSDADTYDEETFYTPDLGGFDGDLPGFWSATELAAPQHQPGYADLDLLTNIDGQLQPELPSVGDPSDLPAPDFGLDQPMSGLFTTAATPDDWAKLANLPPLEIALDVRSLPELNAHTSDLAPELVASADLDSIALDRAMPQSPDPLVVPEDMPVSESLFLEELNYGSRPETSDIFSLEDLTENELPQSIVEKDLITNELSNWIDNSIEQNNLDLAGAFDLDMFADEPLVTDTDFQLTNFDLDSTNEPDLGGDRSSAPNLGGLDLDILDREPLVETAEPHVTNLDLARSLGTELGSDDPLATLGSSDLELLDREPGLANSDLCASNLDLSDSTDRDLLTNELEVVAKSPINDNFTDLNLDLFVSNGSLSDFGFDDESSEFNAERELGLSDDFSNLDFNLEPHQLGDLEILDFDALALDSFFDPSPVDLDLDFLNSSSEPVVELDNLTPESLPLDLDALSGQLEFDSIDNIEFANDGAVNLDLFSAAELNLDDISSTNFGLDSNAESVPLDLNAVSDRPLELEVDNIDFANDGAVNFDSLSTTELNLEGSTATDFDNLDFNLDDFSTDLTDRELTFDGLAGLELPEANLSDLGNLDALLGVTALGLGVGGAIALGNQSELDDLDALVGGSPADNLDSLDALFAPTVPVVKPPAQTVERDAKERRSTTKQSRTFEQTMKVSVKYLDNLNNLVGELVVNRNTLEQDQNRMRQFVEKLLSEVQKLNEVGKRMQDLYERSLMENSLVASRQQNKPTVPSPQISGEDLANSGTLMEYDPLEMDRFTPIHLLSQKMIELTVRVRESTADIEFVVDGSTEVTRTLRQITGQLQEDLTKSRMVPFAQTADRLQRGVRDNGLKYGKQIELSVEGRDTLIDKVILESLTDPLIHMVNNAIAHGIEAGQAREAAGKSIEGKITIRALHQGNQTIISVSDDGAGIDTDRVKAKAIEKGLITAQQAAAMPKKEAYELLFLPGFSTKEEADELSGRGVGMDVVKTSITDIRGKITTESELGMGTTFIIRLPLALSIAKALIAVNNKSNIAFPMDGIEDTQDVSPEQIQTNAEGKQCIFWRDELMPFTPLSDLLGFNRPLARNNFYSTNEDDSDLVSILILRSDGNFTAVQVDKITGDQEIVIKPLQGPASKPLGIAGATVMGDGRIIPIADVMELIALANGTLARHIPTQWTAQMSAPTVEIRESMVLIVDDSITVRELLSLTFKRAGYRVEQARDGQEAWDKLRAGLPCDIVFCDIEMPRMDGLEFLSRIQKDVALSKVPVAMLTSRGSDRHRQIAAQLGASGYFIKPYLEEALLDAAKRMIGGEVLEIV
jgi:chemotaxis protein histidine kinase CheA/ActR/RegA family two-component response regulator